MDTAFYYRLATIAALEPSSRHQALAALHREVYEHYVTSLRAITGTGADRRVPDGRTVNQVVGHIAEWERYAIVSTGELLAGVRWPGLMAHARYLAVDGTEVPFRTNDEFNARQTEQYATIPWPRTRDVALRTAATCFALWAQSGLLAPDLLESTVLWEHYHLPTGVTLRVPCGWFVWMIVMEHEGIEHVDDLTIGHG